MAFSTNFQTFKLSERSGRLPARNSSIENSRFIYWVVRLLKLFWNFQLVRKQWITSQLLSCALRTFENSWRRNSTRFRRATWLLMSKTRAKSYQKQKIRLFRLPRLSKALICQTMIWHLMRLVSCQNNSTFSSFSKILPKKKLFKRHWNHL